MAGWFRSNRRFWLVPVLAGVFVGSLWWCGWLWPFTLGLLLVVWGIRVRNENREDHLFERLVRNYERRG